MRLSMLRQRAIQLALLLIIGGAFFVVTPAVHAVTATSFSIESVGSQVGLGDADLKQTVLNIIRWALGFLTLAAVSYMIYGGFVWLTAAGNEQRVEKAKQIILQAAIGMVIVLLAWAIVVFVARTFANTTSNTNNTNNPGGGCPDINNCGPGSSASTFDISAINTCATPPNTYENVPRSSAVSFTFNTDVKTAPTNLPSDSVYLAVTSGELQIQKCVDPTCSSVIDTDTNTSGVQGPRPINNQVYTPGATTAGSSATPIAEWLAMNNSLTFYHLSFSDVAAESRLFDSATTYRVRVPKDSSGNNTGNDKALRDVRDRVLSYCRNNSQAIGNDIARCQDSSDGKYLEYIFTTSATDAAGPALQVRNTVPSSEYLTNSALQVDRNVPRSAILGIDFSAGVDPASVSTANFRVYKITGVPDNLAKGTCGGGECPGTQIDPSKYSIRVNSGGTGAWLQFTSANEWYEPFTWYKVIVENMRNLCGTVAPKQVWAFETNDVTPGVDFVYPVNEFPAACPSTEVFAQFKTSMWDITKGTSCQLSQFGQPTQASSFNTKAMVYDTTTNAGVTVRNFNFADQPPGGSTDPNRYCKRLSFDPTTAGLPVGHQYSIGLKADRVVNQNGDTLQYGDAVPGFSPANGTPPWHFTVKPADQCYQAPYIASVSPGEDKNGACVSITGNYFEKVNVPDVTANRPDAGDTLTFGGQAQSSGEIKSWTNGAIVNKLNAGSLAVDQKYDYQVGVKYPDPVNQVLLSNKQSFMLRSGGPTRPCLTSLTSNQGYPSDIFSAEGESFGATSGEVVTDNASPWSVTGTWGQSKVSDIQVKATSQTRLTSIQIENSAGVRSNALPYTVLNRNTNPGGTGNGTAPEVVDDSTCDVTAGATPSPNPYKNDVGACLNSTVSVRFSVPLDPTTLTNTTARMFECTETACSQPVTTTVQPAGNLVTLTPAIKLSPSTKYEVVLSTGIKGVPPSPANTPGAGTPMADEYRWQFTTKAGTEDCVISDVTISPNGTQTTNNANYNAIIMSALPIDNACHTLTRNGLKFTWASTNVGVGVLSGILADTPEDIKTLSAPPSGATTGTTDVTVSAQSYTSPKFSLTYNPVACVTTSDCTTNSLGESCGSSTCNAGSCTPVVNAIVPSSGPVSTWPTIQGCWFGGTPGKVIYTDNKEGTAPDPALCGNGTWSNERIIREVPAGAITGAVKVIRNDAAETNFSAGFTVNTAPLDPQICKVSPTSGLRGDTVTVSGQGFGTKGTSDDVTFTFGSSTAIPATLYPTPGWADTSIVLRVPASASIGNNQVKVVKGSRSSNPVNYNVLTALPGSCTTLCTFGAAGDTSCNLAKPGTACSYPGANGLGCCVTRPKIVGTNPTPGSTNSCRNTLAQITFDQPLDGRTVTTNSVGYQDGARIVSGSVSTATNGSQGTISYYPGLLSVSNQQSLSLTPFANDSSTTITVNNASFETANSSDVPDQWPSVLRTKQSSDTPPGGGHGSSSAFADCSGCTTNQQSYIAQNIVNTRTSQASYRVTGWVKVETSDNIRAGLITRCATGSNCRYDLQTPELTPGLFTASSGGWKFVDFVLTNTNNDPSDISIVCFANAKAKAWCDDITVTKVIAQPTTVRGESGALVDPNGSPLNFTTGANICTLDVVSVTPTDDIFTANNEVHPDADHPAFQAEAWPQNMSAPISPVSGTYEWSWAWSSAKSTIASAAMSSSATISPSSAAVTAHANGTTTISAIASVTKDKIQNSTNRKVEGQSNVRVQFCINPWQFTDAANNCDVNNGSSSCSSYNFNLFYCRDNGTTSLPDFAYQGADGTGQLGSIEGINTTDPTRLKSFFFKESATSRDTIGLLIFKNDEFLSPPDWFAKRFPLDTGASSTIIGGYPAVKSGTTTYVGVTNRSGSTLQGLMFVFDYNSNNASPDTVKIATQMLETMAYNTNVTSSVQKGQLIRDTKRRQDLTSLQLSLVSYKAKNGSYPALASGSYITGFTTSKWPSWQTTLGADLTKTLPVDPANTFAAKCEAPYEAATCWAESTKTFSCPANSQVYGYRNLNGAVDIYATMEYRGAGSFTTGTPPSGLCSAPNTCDCFNYAVRVAP